MRETEELEATRAWLSIEIDTGHQIGLLWQSILAFLRITTNARIHPRAASIAEALE